MANKVCPICKKQYIASSQVARHIFGTNDPAHHKWVDEAGMAAVGKNFDDLLIEQITQPGNIAYETIAELVEAAQDKL